jgi:hypothetical protein
MVFAAWVLSVPKEADFGEAARQQIELIDRHALADPDVHFLRTLLRAVAGECNAEGQASVSEQSIGPSFG